MKLTEDKDLLQKQRELCRESYLAGVDKKKEETAFQWKLEEKNIQTNVLTTFFFSSHDFMPY